MKKILLALILVILLGVSGCSLARSPVTNTVDLTKIDFSNAESLQESEACATYILGFIGPIGDAKIIDAIKSANIKKVYAVDYKSGFYVLFSQSCVVVYGE